MLLSSATTISDVISSLTTAFTTGASNMMDAIGGILPVALPVLIAVTVVGVGIKIFRKVTGR